MIGSMHAVAVNISPSWLFHFNWLVCWFEVVVGGRVMKGVVVVVVVSVDDQPQTNTNPLLVHFNSQKTRTDMKTDMWFNKVNE